VAIVKPLAEHELFLLFVQFALLLVSARALGEVAVRLRLPSVVGELLGGFVLGPSLLGAVAPDLFHSIFPAQPEQTHLLEVVSWLGVIMLLILTGLETDIGLIARKGKGAAAISLGGIVVPFASGLALGFLLPSTFVASPGKRLVFALFIGTAMSISAIPVIAKVLMEMKIIRRDIGQITLAAGMIDDTVGWILLSVVAGLATSGTVEVSTVGKALISVLAVLLVAYTVGRKLVSGTIRALDNYVGGDMVKITALMAFALAFGAITQQLKLEAVLGAFIAGILVGQVKRFDERLRHIFEQVALGVFAPVFFASSGLKVDLGKLFKPDVLVVALVVLAVATVGKFAGAYAGARATKLSHWEALSLGAGMNARGAMEIIVATVGLSRGILTPEMYSIILMVAIVTSLMAPPLLRWTLSRVDVGEEEQARLKDEERRRESFVSNLKRVLLPIRRDGDPDVAARLVGMMVNDEGVEVTNLSLVSPNGGDEQAVDPAQADHLRTHLESSRKLVKEADGSQARVILAEAERGYDLLVMATSQRRGGSSGEGSLFDDAVDEVIQASPCPLLVVATTQGYESRGHGNGTGDGDGESRVELHHIVVPVSGSPNDRQAAEVAFSIARGADAVVDLVHVVSGPQHALRVGGDKAIMHAVELGEEVVEKLAELGRSVGARVETDVVVSDHPENAIVERARRRADLVVVSSARRQGTQRAFFGHRVEHILNEVRCPVIVASVG
jgi:Kef-type K+ transport system membrane component KefB/nucleotide-binding universal stress UspA family protein